jgi:hypothetical protein
VKVEPAAKTSEKEISLETGLESDHPLYLQLSVLGAERQQELKHISEEINVLLDRQNHGIVDNFHSEFESLSLRYQEKDREEQSKITQALAQLYQEYSNLPLSEFMGYVKAADMEPFMQAYLRSQQKNDGRLPLSDNLIESHLYQIQHSRSLDELAINVRKTAAIMTLEKIPDANKLIAYQKKMRTSVLETLRKLLFSSNTAVPKDFFTLDNRTRLSEILRSSWVSNPDEHDYYMNEFDILAEGNDEHTP